MDARLIAGKSSPRRRLAFLAALSLAAFPSHGHCQPAAGYARGGLWQLLPPGLPAAGGVFPVGQVVAAFGNVSPLYLVGTFNVTASGTSRCILRHDSQRSYRFIVDFPKGAPVPREGSVVTRDAMHAFLVRDVRTGPDGQTNLYLAEVFQQNVPARTP